MEGKFKGILMGLINIIIALVLLASIISGTASILSANITNLTGVSAIAPLIPLMFIIGQMAKGGWTAWASATGRSSNETSVKDQIIGIVIQYLGIILFPTIIGFLNTAILAAGGPTQTTYPALTVVLGISGLLVLIGVMTLGFMVERRGIGSVTRRFRRRKTATR